MSNNDAPDAEKARGRGLRDSTNTSDGHGDRGKTGRPHVANDTEREHLHLAQGQSQGHNGTGESNIDEEQLTEVGGRKKGDKQSNINGVGTGSGGAYHSSDNNSIFGNRNKQSNSNGVGTGSGGAYHSSDNHSILGNRNGDRFGPDAARGSNMTTNSTPADGMEHYRVNVGYIDVRFMCVNGKGFNVARGIKQFIAAARTIDKDFCLLPLGGPRQQPLYSGRRTKL
jgi:hypothetical protein